MLGIALAHFGRSIAMLGACFMFSLGMRDIILKRISASMKVARATWIACQFVRRDVDQEAPIAAPFRCVDETFLAAVWSR